jgi:glycerol-3-phosphate acyltransferase PlsY
MIFDATVSIEHDYPVFARYSGNKEVAHRGSVISMSGID